jgi:hypothetical protein
VNDVKVLRYRDRYALVAQWIEHQLAVLRAGGSSPPKRTRTKPSLKVGFLFFVRYLVIVWRLSYTDFV